MTPHAHSLCLSLITLLVLVSSAGAQIGGSYDLGRSTIDGGGATFSTGGAYTTGLFAVR